MYVGEDGAGGWKVGGGGGGGVQVLFDSFLETIQVLNKK